MHIMRGQDPGDEPSHHYSAKHRVVSWVSQNLFDNITYTVRNGLLRGMKRKGGLAWLPESLVAESPSPEHRFWKNYDFADLVVYDIGAFHGLLTLFFAERARHVVSYEPNSRNRRRLLENVKLNGLNNVTVRPSAVGAKSEIVTMAASPLTPGGASIERDAVSKLLDSDVSAVSEQVPVTTLDDDIREMNLPAPGFIKIDIEGAELAALTGAKSTLLNHRPRLFLEMHGSTPNLKRAKVAAIVNYLGEVGYTDIRHIESGLSVDPGNTSVAAEGHLYCLSSPRNPA